MKDIILKTIITFIVNQFLTISDISEHYTIKIRHDDMIFTIKQFIKNDAKFIVKQYIVF